VHDLRTYDYAVVRVVPRVERGEFINAGIVLSCDVERVLRASIELDERALRALDANVDMDLVKKSLAVIPVICAGGDAAGPIGKLSPRERFHWLVAPKSTIVQMSPVHTGQCTEIDAAVEHLMNSMVRRSPGARSPGGRNVSGR
jgi:Protein of unknown function (DUF3037)